MGVRADSSDELRVFREGLYKPKKLWLWWSGEGEPDLNLLWRGYVRRFDVEHG